MNRTLKAGAALAALLVLVSTVALLPGRPARAQTNPHIQGLMLSVPLCIALELNGSAGGLPNQCWNPSLPSNLLKIATIASGGSYNTTVGPTLNSDGVTRFGGPQLRTPGCTDVSTNPSAPRCTVIPADFASIDLDGNQLHQMDQSYAGGSVFSGAFIVVFNSWSDLPIQVSTDHGELLPFGVGGSPLINAPTQMVLCNGQLPDCDSNGVKDIGAIGVALGGYGAPRGPGHVWFAQGNETDYLDFKVVGEPFQISIKSFKATVQDTQLPDFPNGSDIPAGSNPAYEAAAAAQCPLPTSLAGFTKALGQPNKSVMLGYVTDTDGTQITDAFVTWKVTPADPYHVRDQIGIMGAPLTPTLDLGSFGFGAPNVFCGWGSTGAATVTAQVTTVASAIGTGLTIDPNATTPSATSAVTVIGTPANMVLAADPASLVCDGTATSSVSATITDSAGKPAVDGQPVHFDAQALGTANPIDATTAGGVAKTTISPLASGAGAKGVTVVVTSGTLSQSIVVACTGAAAPPPPAGGPAPGGAPGAANTTPSGTISPPNTGTGGRAASPPIGWPSAAEAMLAAGALAMLGVATVLRRQRR
ncbi:MAG TPA: Ig-like domain-containing protein [Dehalococcoidia bacterium]|nr:Ig-like domain-containing protein [Dehalococcoidia bacterium]